MCRPSGSVFPRTLTGHLFGPYIGQRQQPTGRAYRFGALLLAYFLT